MSRQYYFNQTKSIIWVKKNPQLRLTNSFAKVRTTNKKCIAIESPEYDCDCKYNFLSDNQFPKWWCNHPMKE